MLIRNKYLYLLLTTGLSVAGSAICIAAWADQPPAIDVMAGMDMGGMETAGHYHSFSLETALSRRHGVSQGTWDLDGWMGGDTNRLWLKSEGEIDDGHVAHAELWAMYGRQVATYWDAQVGLRADARPGLPGAPAHTRAHTYAVAGVTGLAPWFFDTEAHVFVRDDGAVSSRLRVENHWLVTQRLILRPRVEINANGRDDAVAGLGAGLSDVSLGLQTRYEIRREVAPYVDVTWRRKFGGTADYAHLRGEKPDETRVSLGIRWMF